MKRILVITLFVAGLVILIAGFTTPIFAHDPDESGATPANSEAWEAMHEACTKGDWEAMVDAAAEVHGEDFSYMPCHDENNYGSASRSGGMMGRGWGGMMGSMY